jgi:hypothetical protein
LKLKNQVNDLQNKIKELEKNESKCTTYENGDKEWVNEKNQLHRLDGPAVEYRNGDKE